MFANILSAHCRNVWRVINTTASIWCENMLLYLSLDIICPSKLTVFLIKKASLLQNCLHPKTDDVCKQESLHIFAQSRGYCYIGLNNKMITFYTFHFGITCDICILIAAISGVIYSQIAPFYALNHIFFPVNETALLKHNNQLNFKAWLKKRSIRSQEYERQQLFTNQHWLKTKLFWRLGFCDSK